VCSSDLEMSASSCPHFHNCNVPVCPLNPQSLTHAAWFPDEETCHKADLRTAPWIVRQRRIAKATGADRDRGSFTFAILATDFRITKALRGLDPDAGPADSAAVQAWIEKHPAITEAERARLRAQGQKKVAIYGGFASRKGQNGSFADKPASEAVQSHDTPSLGSPAPSQSREDP
jgi:hypothetical protein